MRNEHRIRAYSTGTDADWKTYRDLRNRLKKCIRNAKKSFYHKALSINKPREVWKVIHRVLKPNTCCIKDDPDKLNEHFVSTASRLTGNISNPHDIQTFLDSLSDDDTTRNFKLEHTTYNTILKALKKIRSDCSTGYDNIPIRYLKHVAEALASPLTCIINNCIEKSIFPHQWKTAKIRPILKISNPVKISDYRPISILPILSKVFERVILEQLFNFIEENSVYAKTQSGFRKGHSCAYMLLKLKDDIIKAMNNGDVSICVAADYSKAFDTIKYDELLKHLYQLNFSKSFLKIIHSYLHNRKQYVQFDDKKSRTETIQAGVPQGSILGPS